MILRIEQTKTNFSMQWDVISSKSTLYALIQSPFEKGKFGATFYINEKEIHSLYYNPSDTSWGTKLKDRMSFKILKEEQLIGSIVGQTMKTGFLKGYPYYRIEFNGVAYTGFEIGFGQKGLFLCVYKGEELIAVVEKKLLIIDFKDSYTIYLKEEEYVNLVMTFVIYYDVATYGNVMEMAVSSVKRDCVITLSKELKAKFDPTFIEEVKMMENTDKEQ